MVEFIMWFGLVLFAVSWTWWSRFEPIGSSRAERLLAAAIIGLVLYIVFMFVSLAAEPRGARVTDTLCTFVYGGNVEVDQP